MDLLNIPNMVVFVNVFCHAFLYLRSSLLLQVPFLFDLSDCAFAKLLVFDMVIDELRLNAKDLCSLKLADSILEYHTSDIL